MIPYSVLTVLPHLNAFLNAVCAVLLVAAYRFIRGGDKCRHHKTMICAFVTSAAFMVSYLTYHARFGSIRFQLQGWVRPLYFSILISHTVLAAAVVPLAIAALALAARRRFTAHRAVARWALPIWLYVSVTGVAVYLMLYHL